jgi:deoxyribodipyrimidine photo-lyase
MISYIHTTQEETPSEVSEGAHTLVEKRVNPARVKTLLGNKSRAVDGPVLYWMSREMVRFRIHAPRRRTIFSQVTVVPFQRTRDNFALLHAQQVATSNSSEPQPLAVCFNMVPGYLGATRRHYGFMVKGLKEVEETLKKLNIPFFLLFGEPEETVSKLAHDLKVSHLVTDFSPLRVPRMWKDKLTAKMKNSGVAIQQVRQEMS